MSLYIWWNSNLATGKARCFYVCQHMHFCRNNSIVIHFLYLFMLIVELQVYTVNSLMVVPVTHSSVYIL